MFELKTVEDVQKAMADINGRLDTLDERQKKGLAEHDEWKNLEARFNEVAGIAQNASDLVKASDLANAKHDFQFVGGAAFHITPPDDLDGVNRDYFAMTVLHPSELIRASQTGITIPGMSERVQFRALSESEARFVRLVDTFQELNDMLLVIDAIKCGKMNGTHYAGIGSRGQRMKTLKVWKNYERVLAELQRGMDTTENADWVPTVLSSRVSDLVEVEKRVASLFDRIPMPSNPYDWPILTSDPVSHLVGEATGNTPTTTTFQWSQPGTSKITFNAKKQGVLVGISSESEEDFIIPAVARTLRTMARAIARGEERAIINGSVGEDLDDASFYGTADVAGGYDGLRSMVMQGGSAAASVDAANADLDYEAHVITLKSKQGAFGVDPTNYAWIAEFKGYASARKLDAYQSQEKVGALAQVTTGQMGMLDGSPMIISDQIPLVGTGGLVTAGADTQGSMLGVYRPGFATATKRGMTLEADASIGFLADQIVLRATQRVDFKAFRPLATELAAGYIYDIKP